MNNIAGRTQHMSLVGQPKRSRLIVVSLIASIFIFGIPLSVIASPSQHNLDVQKGALQPDMDGWEAVRHLRKMPEFRTTPIIAVTAHVSPREEERAMAAGCTAHLGKPFETRVLLGEVARLLKDGG